MIGADAGAKLGNGEHQATGGVFEGFGIEMKDESPSARPGLNSPLAQSLVSLSRNVPVVTRLPSWVGRMWRVSRFWAFRP